MTGIGRQGMRVDAKARQGLAPFVIQRRAENQVFVGGNGQPAVVLDFGFQLPRAPARIAEGENAARRAAARNLSRKRKGMVIRIRLAVSTSPARYARGGGAVKTVFRICGIQAPRNTLKI